MPKILKFTLSEYLEKETEYKSMTKMIEQRAKTIAEDLNAVNPPYVIKHVVICEENGQMIAHAVFYNQLNPDDKKNFDFNAEWLFTDEHLRELPPEVLRQRRFGMFFDEFMQLKAESKHE